MACPGAKEGIYAIPDGVERIGGWAFSQCTRLASVTLPESLSTIGRFAFADCTKLTSVTIPAGVTKVEDGAFAECTVLSEETRADIRERFGKAALGEADEADENAEEHDESTDGENGPDDPPFLGEAGRIRVGNAEISGYVAIKSAHGQNTAWNGPEKIGGFTVAQVGSQRPPAQPVA